MANNKKTITIIATSASLISIATGLIFLYTTFRKPNSLDLTGQWEMNFVVKSSTYKPYIDMDFGYKIYVQQNGNSISARGEKWTLNGDTLPYKDHIPIEFKGKVNDKDFTASYILHGRQRETVGEVDLLIQDKGESMTGRFSGTSADAKGIVYAKRLN